MLHGFTQTGRCLGPIADALEIEHCLVRPDLPGHGDATDLADMDLPAIARHLVTAISPTLDGPAVWFGYSMGARVALQVALDHPGSVAGLVLVGITPGIVDDDERAARRRADAERAARIAEIGVDRFFDEWLSGPLFTSLPESARFIDERRRNSAVGLASSLRHAGTGSMEPLWDRLGEIAVPVLLVTGGDDERFSATAREMAELVPDAEFVEIDGSGHAAHLERPGAVLDAVGPFCRRLGPVDTERPRDPTDRWYRRTDA